MPGNNTAEKKPCLKTLRCTSLHRPKFKVTFHQAACTIFCTQFEDTHTMVDKVGDVALVSCIHCVHVLHIVQIK